MKKMEQFANNNMARPTGKLAMICLLALLLMPASQAFAKPITLNLKGADIAAVISTVSEATGKNFIVDPRVKGKVTVVSSKPLDSKELYQVFLAVLEVHGFSAVPAGNVIKILPDADAKSQATPMKGDGQEVVTRVVEIHHVAAAQMVPILRPLVPPQGHLAAHAQTNMLIISDRAANIDRLMDIVKAIDAPSGSEIEMVQLLHASAAEVVRVLTSLQRAEKKNEPQSEQSTLVADERTNSILMGGEKSNRMQLKAIIAHLDAPSETVGNTHVIYLHYSQAKDLVAVLTGVGQSAAKETAKGTPKAAGTADFSIQADESSNALVITAAPDIYRSLEAVIRKLDVRRAQVLVEAIIAEVSLSKSNEMGVQWFGDGSSRDLPVGGTNFKTGSITSLSGVAGGLASGDVASLAGGVGQGLTIGMGRFLPDSLNFGVLISALAGEGGANLLSTPNILTMDNEEAEIFVGDEVSVPTGSFTSTGTSSTPTNPFTTFKPKQVGIRLKVKPQINEGDAIKLDIEQTVDQISAGDAGAANLTTSQRSIKTSVMVDDADTVVLGGLIKDTELESSSKVPLLGDIPLLGNLFKYKTRTKGKTNLMVFLRPQILRDAAVTAAVTGSKYTYMRDMQLMARNKKEKEVNELMPPFEEIIKKSKPPKVEDKDGENP